MKALLAGYGGIGSSVYYPELKGLGHDVDIYDTFAPEGKKVPKIKKAYDLAVICTPNFTHETIARTLAETGTKEIFIEKPGVSSVASWSKMCDDFPDTNFHLVKNNLFRDSYGNIVEMVKRKDLMGVDITWYSNNRIPNPGSWFTTRDKSFGGVEYDLMPHLYCFALIMFGEDKLVWSEFSQHAYRRWDLKNIQTTSYGKVDPNGIYDVNDVATAHARIGRISLKMSASWKEGYDKQSVTLFFKDGMTYEWNFGLCPANAYGKMLQCQSDSRFIDTEIHNFLEGFE